MDMGMGMDMDMDSCQLCSSTLPFTLYSGP